MSQWNGQFRQDSVSLSWPEKNSWLRPCFGIHAILGHILVELRHHTLIICSRVCLFMYKPFGH